MLIVPYGVQTHISSDSGTYQDYPPYLVKSFFLENQGFFQYIINKYLRRRSHRNGHFSVSGTKIADFRYTK